MPLLRRFSLLVLVLSCTAATPAFAQEWEEPSDMVPPGAVEEWDNDWEDWDVPVDSGAPPAPAAAPPAPAQNPAFPSLPPVPVRRTIAGRVARIRTDGKAAVPLGAPKVVRAIIASANQIIGKPYKWGGGHGRLIDSGYDCSGSVSYALIRAGLLGYPMVSGQFARWNSRGRGRWVSIYGNRGHVYMEIAGLRLDTSSVGDPTGRRGVRWRPVIGQRGGFAVRHPAGL